MRRVIAWFWVATLCVLTSTAGAANDVLKPYVVLILDTSGSMLDTTGSGPTSCGKSDNKINHAVCAINNIVNSYGDMVFGLARFAETAGGSPNNTACTSGCTTLGPYCGDCDPSTGQNFTCNGNGDCDSGSCVNGFCAGTLGCHTNDSLFQLLAPLVDGQNGVSATFTDGTCDTCQESYANGNNPELWGVNAFTYTPLAAVLKGDKRYWQGLQATDSTTIWNQNLPGYDPINRDPNNAVFLQTAAGTPSTSGCNADHATCDTSPSCVGANCCCTSCNSNHASCDASVSCNSATSNNCCCDTCNPNASTCATSGNFPNRCCATQCRPYVTILLTDGDETCGSFGNDTRPAASALLTTQPHVDGVNNVFGATRSGGLTTIQTTTAHPFAAGNKVVVSGVSDASFNGTFNIKTVTDATHVTYDQVGQPNSSSSSGTIRHAASDYTYRVETKPIGFGKTPGDSQIENLAHDGGAADLPGVNEGYYASNEADLELAISQILADSVRSESCNGRDDDCDTRVDEDFPNKNTSCTNGQLGVCLRTGTFVCRTDGTGLQCTAPSVTPGVEVCNQLDDDCDGRVDENPDSPLPPINCQPCVGSGEICDGNDQDCDGVADLSCRCSNDATKVCNSGNVATQCGGSNTCVCSPPLTQGCANTNSFGSCPGTKTCTSGAYGACVGQVPAAEACDGQDNDCDGICDGVPASCSEVVTPCVATNGASCPASDNPGDASHGPILHSEKTIACTNAVDDDGDGAINDGCPAVNAAETACNDAVDDDGDGRINDGCPAQATALIPQNVCHAGARQCNVPPACPNPGGNSYTSCTGELKPAASDPCNGLDDDCDNAIDEDFAPADCSTNCGIGTTQCTAGQITCNSTPAGDDTTCNGIDDNCNGVIDEGWVCDPSPTCTGLDCCACGTGTTCEQNQCINGQRTCVVSPPINPEVCNCNDDNCNGQVDEGTLCPSGAQCTNCQCAFPCAEGEFPCPLGKKCDPPVDTASNCTLDSECPSGQTCVTVGPNHNKCTVTGTKFCVSDPCYGVNCPAVNGHVQVCIPSEDPLLANEHECVDKCTVKSPIGALPCPTNFVCVDSDGECHPNDCITFPNMCATNQACVVRDGLGTCVTNPCAGVTCGSGTYCLGGTCVESCADLDCPSGQRCRQGMCETDPCGHPCPFGQACNDNTGKCINDPCGVRDCGTDSGQWCNPNSGQCEDDPCQTNHITCPNAGEVCRGGTCLDPDSLAPDAAGEAHVTVGGGGGCNTTGGGSTGVLLALALVVIRRRRARASSAARGEGGAS